MGLIFKGQNKSDSPTGIAFTMKSTNVANVHNVISPATANLYLTHLLEESFSHDGQS